MIRYVIVCSIFFRSLFVTGTSLSANNSQVFLLPDDVNIQQTPQDDYQLLYNGRVWKNLYYNIRGDEYLFSKEFLNGTVTMNGKTFKDLKLRYDIYNDELILMVNAATYLQLNKEMVTGFTLDYNYSTYNFKKLSNDNNLTSLSGYVNILYEGKTFLYQKYRKEILKLAVDHKYDQFNQKQNLFLVKDGQNFKISGKRDFLKLLEDRRDNLKEYIKSEKLKVNKNRSESYISILKYYDSLR